MKNQSGLFTRWYQELANLLKVHRTEIEESLGNKAEAPRTSAADNGPYLEIPISPEEPWTIAVREGIHKKIQAEIQHKAKEAEAMVDGNVRGSNSME